MSDFESETPEMRRKLTTLLHADVCGYSRLMGQNELATLTTLKEYKSVVSGILSRHHGRTVNWTGDGLLAEFGSVVEAVEAGAEIQNALTELNDQLDDDRRMDFRIGINLGDVMVDGEELFGEGVNIAARLQSIAPIGGVLISGTAFDQVESKLAFEFDFVGRQRVKNIAAEVPAYALVVDPDAQTPTERVTKTIAVHGEYRAPIPAGSTGLGPIVQPSPDPAEIYAGFWRRSIAFAIDWSMAYVTCVLLADLIGYSSIVGLALPVYLAYLTGFESGPWQASVGKKVMGIRVVDLNGEPLTLIRAFGRNFAKLLSVLTFFVGFAMAGFTDRKQALHDRLAEAVLIDEDTLAQQQGRPQKIWT